jgi:GNAT superfamily N-acetyltransferase
MTVDFRYAAFNEYRRISRFLDDYWAKDHVYVRVPELFEWTFNRSGFWDRHGYSFALAEAKGEIVGILGGIPFIFNRFGKTSRAAWLANYIVRPDYRRGPIGIQLLSMFRPPYEVVAGFGVKPSVIPFFRLLRWRVLEDIPRHFMVLPEAEERMAHLLHLAQPDWPEDRAAVLARFFRIANPPRVSIACMQILPPKWDECDWPQIASKTVGAARDLEYLTWRYLRHPVFRYRILGVPDGKRTGLLIWRLETIRSVTPNGAKEVDRLGRVVEFLPTSRSNARQLLTVFLQQLAEMQALGADYYGYHGHSRVWLEEFGFRAIDQHPDGPAIPSRFQPLDRRGGSISGVLSVRDEVPICAIEDGCPWYWTKSDSDQDRPN